MGVCGGVVRAISIHQRGWAFDEKWVELLGVIQHLSLALVDACWKLFSVKMYPL